MTTMTEPTTSTLEAPGAVLTYDVRRNADSAEPVLLLIGSPMGASGFGTLAGHFPDRTVVTYDPRGVERSTNDGPGLPVDARGARRRPAPGHRGARRRARRPVRQQRRRRQRAGPGRPHPEDVRTLVAHEPPLAAAGAGQRVRAGRRAARSRETYQRGGMGAGDGDVHRDRQPPGADRRRLPRAAGAGSGDVRPADARTTGRGRRPARPEHALVHRLPARLRCAPRGIHPHRRRGRRGVRRPARARAAARRLAARLGIEAVEFPSDHGGFLGGEYGQSGKPDEFAAGLRGRWRLIPAR